jgi:hypothetical protein
MEAFVTRQESGAVGSERGNKEARSKAVEEKVRDKTEPNKEVGKVHACRPGPTLNVLS